MSGDSWKDWGPDYGYNVEAHGFLVSLGFEDTTWHNDGCPSFHHHGLGLRVWIDHVDPELREMPYDRFSLCRYTAEFEWEEDVASAEDWLTIARILREQVKGDSE